ncbi:Stk1 family PASTA domain-containing Ser/Thr kinase [Lactococcus nasutitermitis]|uniref:non-specific serine/threonine protein kinase n=1 Tax=Lactococcus nasutitermitis TaxID=1652957 RepID=A0ABV9JB48_9LACT|nr:Stk1 family PASTA domain-containing Ser/Thr kinase [Lactococcus nasutitermitis]
MIQIGKIFADRYRIIKEIGRGGMANVYQGEDTFLGNRQVAIKVLRSNFENDNIAIARFQREAFAMAELSHPNIVGISDVGEFETQQYIVMEYIEGMTLKQYINENAPLSNDEAIEITMEILSAMEMAHSHGIIHRDLKPQNVLVALNGTVKVTDFGIAKALSETSLTQTNTMFGSVHYLSPEQARGANATVQSDIYAIGIILFELLTGQIPFDGDSAVAIALKHFQENIPSIINLNSSVPQALENVVIKATAKDTKNRYPDVTEMMNDLATSTSLDRRGETKIIFKKDNDATRIMPANLINPYDTKPLIDKKDELKSDETQAENLSENQDINDKHKKTKNKKSKKGLIAALIVILLVVAGSATAWVMLTPHNTKVPDVAGMTVSQAEAKIRDAHLKVGSVEKQGSSTVNTGDVIKTNPDAGTQVRTNSSVDIYESEGNPDEFTLENYVGKKYNDVYQKLLQAGVADEQIVENSVSSDAPKGTIIKQTPGKGKTITLGGDDVITFEVSAGKLVAVPDFSHQTYTAYKATLEAAGFTNVVLDPVNESSNQSWDGYVWQVNPDVGQEVDPSKQIVVTYSVYVAPATPQSSSTTESSTTAKESSSPESSSSSEPATTTNSSSQPASTTTQSSSSKAQ